MFTSIDGIDAASINGYNPVTPPGDSRESICAQIGKRVNLNFNTRSTVAFNFLAVAQ